MTARRAVSGSLRSKDGTTIGYRQVGSGPGLVVLHGIMESAQSHAELAEELADEFTVYLPDRRGRGLSGPQGAGHGILKEIEDLEALLERTGSTRVFGVSAGAVICLHGALTLTAIERAAIFEPPLLVDGSVSTDFLRRFDEEIAAGRVAAALVTAMKGSQMGPPALNLVPRPLLERLTKRMTAGEDKRAKPGDVTMTMLASTLHDDFQLSLETAGALESLRAIRAEILLLGGSNSPAYLKVALDALENILPDPTRVELTGLNHGATGNKNRGGKPDRVASELRSFFAQDRPLCRPVPATDATDTPRHSDALRAGR